MSAASRPRHTAGESGRARALGIRSKCAWLLLGDWTPWLRDPIDLLRLSFLVGAVITLISGPQEQSLRLLLTFLLVLIPRLVNAPRPFDLAFNVGMAFQAWGNVFGAFDSVTGYDKLVHFVLPCATSMLMYLVLVRARLVPDLANESAIHTKAAMILVTFALGVTVGVAYEVYEYLADHLLGAGLYVSYGDTIGDLVDDALGAAVGGLLVMAWDAHGWATTRRRPAGRID